MDTFGEWLRQQRNLLKLTRLQFADRVGCSVALLRKIEDGERRPSVQIAELMANSLDIPSADRPTFLKVARGELGVNRLRPAARPVTTAEPLADPPVPRTNLPVLPTPLIGRQRELEELRLLLCDPECRLLTLVGPGGMGKTRLAIETAFHAQDGFPDGVFYVPLAPANSSRLIVPVIADAIGFAFQSANTNDSKTQLLSYLKEKQALLLMDNLEQLLVEPGIEFLSELLENANGVKLLATSRESLGLQFEWVFEVHGLPVPESQTMQGSSQNTSVELFLQRTRRAYVEFNATQDDFAAIVRICQLVEGMPLGIELAAAWVRTLTCDEIVREIENGLDFLSGSARDLPARHRSMRAVFDHSWKLLSQEEQGVLRQLSTFQGGFLREAAEVVAGATLSTLSTLVTKSLIRRSGAGRFDLHNLIRQYAAEQLAQHSQEHSASQRRHGLYYLTFFGQADGRLRSPAQGEALVELSIEMDNFRLAWNWAILQGEFALIEQVLRTFAMLYDTRGWLQEGCDTLAQAVTALESAHKQTPPDRAGQVALGHLLTTWSLLTYRLAQHEQAQAMLERSLEILRPLNESRVLAETLPFLGVVMLLTGDYARAMQLFTEGLEHATAAGDRWFIAMCLSEQVNVAMLTGESQDTYERMQNAMVQWRLIGDPRFTAFGLNLLSQSALMLGRYDEARAALEESVSLNMSVGARWNLGAAYQGLGAVAQAQGQHQQAVAMFRKSLDTFTELGGRQFVAQGLADLGRSLFALGENSAAQVAWLESLHIATQTHGVPVALEALVGLANLEVKQGKLEHAFELLLIVIEHPASVQLTRDRSAQLGLELQAQLTSQQVEAARARMHAQTFNSVVDEILKI